MNSEEALVYWITALQQHAAECEFGTNADPTDIAPRLFVYGMKGCAGMYAEVDVFKDDPSRVLSEEWSPIELRAD